MYIIYIGKPKLCSTCSIYSDLRDRTIIQVYERVVLLYTFKVNIGLFQNLHCYNTRIKNNCNIIVPHNHTNVGTKSPMTKGILLFSK